jgi:D-alanyl-D-alanine carboxypeptidase
MGIKTGFTSTAGGCLASYVKIQGREFIIVVLKCKKVNSRFKDTEILKRWLMKKEGLKK